MGKVGGRHPGQAYCAIPWSTRIPPGPGCLASGLEGGGGIDPWQRLRIYYFYIFLHLSDLCIYKDIFHGEGSRG